MISLRQAWLVVGAVVVLAVALRLLLLLLALRLLLLLLLLRAGRGRARRAAQRRSVQARSAADKGRRAPRGGQRHGQRGDKRTSRELNCEFVTTAK